MTDPQRTLLAFLLDRSGSMETIKSDMAAPAGSRVAGFSDEDRQAAKGESA
ncbi:MAG TPA: hypothetical protein VE666_13480 [Mycobacterium sp.]|jgi:hypothetical protein|nr:hypothetical protein [Mycobacterium sp.]